MSRAPKQPIIYQEKLNLSPDVTRFATPKEPAIYRAKKLACEKIVEIGAGIGGQTMAFSKTCKKVIAIEINKDDAKILTDNLKKLKIKNVEVIVYDALSPEIIKRVEKEKPDIIFCDSARKPEGERLIKDIQPDLKKLLKEYSKITKKIAIEIPPFTQDTQTIGDNFEKEFLSLNKQLNRLTLYFNELKESDVSVIEIPQKEKIKKTNEVTKSKIENSSKEFKYLYEISPAVILSGLVEELASKINASRILLEGKEYLISKEKKQSSFLTEYKIVSTIKNSFEEIIKELKKIDAKKIILKFKISPEDYWKERKKYEDLLSGTKEYYLFLNAKEAIIAEK